jgi:hypothetical protein
MRTLALIIVTLVSLCVLSNDAVAAADACKVCSDQQRACMKNYAGPTCKSEYQMCMKSCKTS